MYWLPQAGILANKLLRKRLKLHGYYKVNHTPGLWRHCNQPIQVTLVVDNFGIKYTHEKDLEYLIKSLKENYELSIDREGALYCDIILYWNYDEG